MIHYQLYAIKFSCPKKLVLKSFLDTILQSRSVCYVDIFYVMNIDKKQTFSDHLPTLSLKHIVCKRPLTAMGFSAMFTSLYLDNNIGKHCIASSPLP